MNQHINIIARCLKSLLLGNGLKVFLLLLQYIDDAVKALEISLTNEDLTYLEEMYVPHPIVGAINENQPQGTVLLDKK